MRYFIVNQRRTYKEEASGSYIWAPIKNKKGQLQYHWESLLRVKKGDIIFSNVNGKLISVNIAKGSCYDADNPFDGADWKKEGRKIDVQYNKLERSIVYGDHLKELLELQPKNGAFNSKRINQGYLFEITKGQFLYLSNLIETSGVIDAAIKEETEEATEDLLDQLNDEQQFRDIQIGKTKFYTEEEYKKLLKDRENKKPSESLCNSKKRYKTDAKLKATCLEMKKYQCEISDEHVTFSNVTGLHQYVECHHLIPMKAQKDFSDQLWIDDLFNLSCLCPLCHAQIHYGDREAKEKVFWKIYGEHKKLYAAKGITKEKMKSIFNKYYF